jgi:hypothetical protein
MALRAGALTGLLNQPTAQVINGSLRFDSATDHNLRRTPGSAGNRKTWTWSAWVKKTSTGSTYAMFGSGTDSTNLDAIDFNGEQLRYTRSTSGSFDDVKTNALHRDPSGFYHVVCAVDTTQSTSSNRVKLYVNGVHQTSLAATNYPSENETTFFSSTEPQVVGRRSAHQTNSFDGAMTQCYFIDGQALGPESFGFTDPLTNTWRPKKYTGTYGTNGFWLPMDNQDDFEKDKSGNGNDFTKNNFSGTSNDPDVVKDSPSGAVFGGRAQTGITTISSAPANYATLNPVNLHNTSDTISDGNLKLTGSGSGAGHFARSTLAMSTGKYFMEVTWISTQKNFCGIQGSGDINYNNSYVYLSNAKASNNNGSSEGSSYGATWGNDDVIGIAYDADAKTLTFYKNGVSQGVAFTGITGTYTQQTTPGSYTFFFGNWDNQNCTFEANFGQKPFKYAPPQGYLPLNSTKTKLKSSKNWFLFYKKVSKNTHFSYLLSNTYVTKSKVTIAGYIDLITCQISVSATSIMNKERNKINITCSARKSNRSCRSN